MKKVRVNTILFLHVHDSLSTIIGSGYWIPSPKDC
jgi:hypothetical protein